MLFHLKSKRPQIELKKKKISLNPLFRIMWQKLSSFMQKLYKVPGVAHGFRKKYNLKLENFI